MMISMAVVKALRTQDGQFRVLVHEDQTAELCDARGKTILDRSPMYKVSQRLAEFGVQGDDLVED